MLTEISRARKRLAHDRMVEEESNLESGLGSASSLSEISIDELDDMAIDDAILLVASNRYYDRPDTYRPSQPIFTRDLYTNWLSNDDEFRAIYRMDRSSFYKVRDAIKDHDVFKPKWRKKQAEEERIFSLVYWS